MCDAYRVFVCLGRGEWEVAQEPLHADIDTEKKVLSRKYTKKHANTEQSICRHRTNYADIERTMNTENTVQMHNKLIHFIRANRDTFTNKFSCSVVWVPV